MLRMILLAIVNAFSCHHDWQVAVDHRSFDCSFTAVEVWRYQKPETILIDLDIPGPQCRWR